MAGEKDISPTSVKSKLINQKWILFLIVLRISPRPYSVWCTDQQRWHPQELTGSAESQAPAQP